MALTGIDFVDTDLSTVLFALMSPTGSENSAWGSVVAKFGVGGTFKAEAPLDAERFERPMLDGAFTTFTRRSLGRVSWVQILEATTEANLRLGVDRITDLVTRGTTLRITAGSTRYLKIEPSAYPAPFDDQELTTWNIYTGFHTKHGVRFDLACQPYWEGAAVTSSADTVEDDPATGTPDGSRIYALTYAGSLPTPGQVKAQMDTGSGVAAVKIGHRFRGTRASSFFSDYLSDTGWFQCEATGRNWTITLSNDTSATTDGALASPGSGNVIAQVNGAGSTAGTLLRRVRATRTTALDSIRGTWVPSVRFKATGVASWEVQLRYSPSLADPTQFAQPIYTHTIAAGTTTFGYIEPDMGRMYVPETVALGGVAVELWARRVSGTGNLNFDLVDLWPAQGLGTVIVAGGSTTSTQGASLTSAVANPAGGTAGTPSGAYLNLDNTTDNAGVGTGSARSVGRYRTTWSIQTPTPPGVGGTIRLVVRNVTDSADRFSETVATTSTNTITFTRDWDVASADGSDVFQEQVDDPNATFVNNGRVHRITTEFIPAVLVNEYVRTNPSQPSVDRLDTSGNFSGALELQGALPVLLQPGDNHIKVRADDIPLSGYTENENKLDRDPSVTVTYTPRYSL